VCDAAGTTILLYLQGSADRRSHTYTGLLKTIVPHYLKTGAPLSHEDATGCGFASEIVDQFLPNDPSIQELSFDFKTRASETETIRKDLAAFFPPQLGFGTITKVNYTDGVRITFDTGDVAHLRPSGNADEFRVYAVADTQARADFIARAAIAQPHGILRQMEKALVG
jgi:hypothetical protein